MKKNLFNLIAILMIAVMSVSFVSCGSDDDKEESGISESILGTWYMLESDSYGWVIHVTMSSIKEYELYKSSGKWKLESAGSAYGYTINGNKLTSLDGGTVSVSISGNSMTVRGEGQALRYTKYNGTPDQFIDYMNKK